MLVFLGLAPPLAGCARTMTLHPEVRYVAIHCTKGQGNLDEESMMVAADYERGTPDTLMIHPSKVKAFDSCKAVVADETAVCSYDVVPVCHQGDCSVAIHTCH